MRRSQIPRLRELVLQIVCDDLEDVGARVELCLLAVENDILAGDLELHEYQRLVAVAERQPPGALGLAVLRLLLACSEVAPRDDIVHKAVASIGLLRGDELHGVDSMLRELNRRCVPANTIVDAVKTLNPSVAGDVLALALPDGCLDVLDEPLRAAALAARVRRERRCLLSHFGALLVLDEVTEGQGIPGSPQGYSSLYWAVQDWPFDEASKIDALVDEGILTEGEAVVMREFTGGLARLQPLSDDRFWNQVLELRANVAAAWARATSDVGR